MGNFKITWYGHSFFSINAGEKTIAIDPFTDIGYQLPKFKPDIVISTHDHFDHNNFSLFENTFEKVTKEGSYTFDNISIKTFNTFHDETEGKERGSNLLAKISFNGISILHCGDLGHVPPAEVLDNIGKTDILMIPIGGFYTIDSDTAFGLAKKINPGTILPMHYKTPELDFPITDEKHFIELSEKEGWEIGQLNKIDINIDEVNKLNKVILLSYK